MPSGTRSSTVRAAKAVATGLKKFRDVTLGQLDAVLASVLPQAWRLSTGVLITATEAAGGFNVAISSEVFFLQAEVTDNETEASVGYAAVTLPPNYKAGTPLTVRIPCRLAVTGSPTNNGSTIDLEVRRQESGAVGSDLVSTAAQTFAATATWYNKDFTVDGATLLPGDTLILKMTSNIIDSEAGAGTLRFNADTVLVLGSVNG